MNDGSIEIQVIGAIRLALEGAADDETALAMVRNLLEKAPDTPAHGTSSVELFLEAVRELRGRFVTNYVEA